MKRLFRTLLLVLSIAMLVAACVPSKDDVVEVLSSVEQTAAAQITYVPVTYTPSVNDIVQMTFAAMTMQAAGQPAPATSTPLPPSNEAGSISGKLSYPSSAIPPLRVVAFNLFDHSYRYVDTQFGQGTYQISGLTPGKYHVVSYVQGGGLAGGYTKMVPCGLSAECTDHSLIDVIVLANSDTPNIDPGDWYAPADAFPPMPIDAVALPSATLEYQLTGNGGFAGKIGYPAESNPPMRIVAFRKGNFNEYYSIVTTQGQNEYSMSLPGGAYYIVAYTLGGNGFPGGLSGAYTNAVICGLAPGCNDHSLAEVHVSPMVVLVIDANIYDWYVPDGIIPPNPYP